MRECCWKLEGGPTMGEIYTRAELIAAAMELKPNEYVLPVDRAALVVIASGREVKLIAPHELKAGHWEHAAPHSQSCEQYA